MLTKTEGVITDVIRDSGVRNTQLTKWAKTPVQCPSWLPCKNCGQPSSAFHAGGVYYVSTFCLTRSSWESTSWEYREKIPTKMNVADLLTKPMYGDLFWQHLPGALSLIHDNIEIRRQTIQHVVYSNRRWWIHVRMLFLLFYNNRVKFVILLVFIFDSIFSYSKWCILPPISG